MKINQEIFKLLEKEIIKQILLYGIYLSMMVKM